MSHFTHTLHTLLNRLKGKRWKHNRIYPRDFQVRHVDGGVQFNFKGQQLFFPKAIDLAHQFTDQSANVVLSGPSIRTIEQPVYLAQSFCFAVNGSPAFFTEHQLKYDAYVVDDPRYLAQHSQQALEFAAQAQYVFFSYRSIYLLMKQEADLRGLNIYIFDYQFMPFRKKSPTPKRPFFAQQLDVGLGKADTIVYIVLQLAYGMGFSKVALFGLDLTIEGRFYHEDKPAPQHLHDNWQEGIIKPFMLVRDITQQHWSVMNCSPNSLLSSDILPKCEPNNYLMQHDG